MLGSYYSLVQLNKDLLIIFLILIVLHPSFGLGNRTYSLGSIFL